MFSQTRTVLEQFDNQHDFERMVADILNALGYTEVVLIAPRGGSDEGKDITFTTESGRKGLACVTLRKDIEAKFKKDFSQRTAGEYEKYILFCTAYMSAQQKRKFALHCLEILEAEFVPMDIEALRSLLDSSLKSIRQSYLNIKDDSKGITEEALAALDDMDRKHQALILLSKAENATNLAECEKFTRDSLQKYPNLPSARSLLGLRLSNEVRGYFIHQLHPAAYPQVIEGLGRSVTPMYYTQFAQSPPAPPKLSAIHWLEQALQYEDDPDGNITGSLALMYGYNDAYDKMIETLQKACTINPSLISNFQSPDNLMMLIYACHDLASVEEIMQNVNLKLPKLDEVQQALREASDPKHNRNAFAQPYIEWYALELRMGNVSRLPVIVRIVFPNKDRLAYAQVSPLSPTSITIPKQTSTTGLVDTLIPVEDILKQLAAIGIVLIALV